MTSILYFEFRAVARLKEMVDLPTPPLVWDTTIIINNLFLFKVVYFSITHIINIFNVFIMCIYTNSPKREAITGVNVVTSAPLVKRVPK